MSPVDNPLAEVFAPIASPHAWFAARGKATFCCANNQASKGRAEKTRWIG